MTQVYLHETALLKALIKHRLDSNSVDLGEIEKNQAESIERRYKQNKDRKDAKWNQGKLYINGFLIPKDLNEVYEEMIRAITYGENDKDHGYSW